MLAPICLFTYNRLAETQNTIEHLKMNRLAPLSDLYIFSDGAKTENGIEKIGLVRDYIKRTSGFKSVEIIESSTNKGLANSIIDGVSSVLRKYGRVIVLEDDLISTPYFLDFMNDALDYYDSNKRVQSVNGYSVLIDTGGKGVYFQTRPFPWGWGTWSDRWSEQIFDKRYIREIIEQDQSILKRFRTECGSDISKMLTDSLQNINDSWYVRWTFDHFLKNNYSAFPFKSYIQNIGHNEDGTHCKGINTYKSELTDIRTYNPNFWELYEPDRQLKNDFLKYFSMRFKITERLKLLPSRKGRESLIQEIRQRIGK